MDPAHSASTRLSLRLLPDPQAVVDVTGSGQFAYASTPGKVTIYKRTITAVDFPAFYYVFGLSMYNGPNGSAPYAQDQYMAVLDAAGNQILPSQTLFSLGYSGAPSSSFWLLNQTVAPYGGTFYLVLWGDSAFSGTVESFPIVNDG